MNYSRKTGRILKLTGRTITLFESIDDADGSPCMPAAIQFATSNIACQGKRDCDVVHGEVHRSSPGNMAELQSDCCVKTTSACNRCNRLSHAHSAAFRLRPSVRCASQL